MKNKFIYQEAPKYYHYYFDLVSGDDLINEFEKSLHCMRDLSEKINRSNENFSYQENKWTTKQVIRHIIDCERVFGYRALRFARFDNTVLASFDENQYMAPPLHQDENLENLMDEFISLRRSTISLYKSMNDQMLDFKGSVDGIFNSARTIGFMIVGHQLHHCHFLEKNYLNVL
jgi:hypothetical protein